MVAGIGGEQLAKVENLVEAYESALFCGGELDLAAYLPPDDDTLYLPVLCELIRVDLEYCWCNRRPRRLEAYQERFPELFRNRDYLAEIAFEEYRLRRQMGDDACPVEYEKRWGVTVGDWPRFEIGSGNASDKWSQVRGSRPDVASAGQRTELPFPAPGDEFLDFALIAELGRGAFGRVYLARQKGLFGRHVVLKVATNISLEARTLVQLQHTNIVPVYSVHEAGPLHALCMPYLGATTLAGLLKAFHGQRSLPQSGKGLVDTATACLSATREGLAVPTNSDQAQDEKAESGEPVCWTQLERLTYVGAVLWLGERLADGLAHAHERGILHRDLKPANILLTREGQPMLVDFNLSEDVKRQAGPAAFIGGTLPYMAPEQLRAFRAGNSAVDGRGDVYSLGVVLYELLTGRQPYPQRTGPLDRVLDDMLRDRRGSPPRLRGWNRSISPAVESVIRHCLESDAKRRYRSARELQEDLRRHAEHRPLKHAPEASRVERAAKFCRRHPRLALAGVACTALTLIAALATMLVARDARHAHLEAVALSQQFRDEARRARVLLVTSPLSDRERIAEGMSLANRALGRYQVRENPKWWDAPEVRRLSPADQGSLREEAGDVTLLLASVTALQARTGADSDRPAGLRAALQLNQASASSYPDDTAPVLVQRQREGLVRALNGQRDVAREDVPLPGDDPQPAKDLCMIATDLMGGNRFTDALPLWRRAARQSPADLWAWTGLAACYENLAKYEDAASCYSTAIALAPEQDWLYFKRGTVYLREKDYPEARADFDRFLGERPGVPEAYINRAVAQEALRAYRPAIADITKAIELGTSQTRAYFIRALLRERIGDREGAQRDKQTGSKLEPVDELSCVVRGLERFETDPKAALDDFDRAMRFNPRSLDGMQNRASVLSEKLGQTPEAVAILDREIELYPTFVSARAGRGVLLARLGKRKEALRDAEECLRQDSQPATIYQVAGIYALTSKQQPQDREEAVFLLSTALRKGYGKDLISIDTDLDPIRSHPDFRRLLGRAGLLSDNH
jgi:serine/threonine protein kinase/tetratricopeptide (TPR) repeat protein